MGDDARRDASYEDTWGPAPAVGYQDDQVGLLPASASRISSSGNSSRNSPRVLMPRVRPCATNAYLFEALIFADGRADPLMQPDHASPGQEALDGSVVDGRRVLLICGIVSSLLYGAMNVFIPMQWQGYSSASQTVSELSAIGAPTRPLWVSLGIAYALLMTAFGWGVWSDRRNRPLRVAGGLMVAYGAISLAWPFAPMHLRGAELTLTDTMHIVFAMVTVLLMLLAIGFGAAAFGKRFRLYSIATMMILAAFGALTGLEGPRIAANLPTPWIGVWERINIGVFLLWVVVLAIALLRAPDLAAGRGDSR